MSILFSLKLKKESPHKACLAPEPKKSLFLEGKNGKACLFIHGLTGTPYEMRFLANSLNRKGYSVFCPRLFNHGKPLGVLKYTKWQDFYRSVREEFLKANLIYNSIFVSGLSMGALFALLLAAEFPDRVAGVCCLSPTLFYDGWNTPWLKFLLPLGCKLPLKYFLYFKEEPPYGIKNEAIRGFVDRYYSKAKLDDIAGIEQYGYPFFPFTLLNQLNLLKRYLIPKLPSVHAPVLLMQAYKDDMTSPRNSWFIYERVGSAEKKIFFLYDSYHLISADQERDKVAAQMELFFSGKSREKIPVREEYLEE